MCMRLPVHKYTSKSLPAIHSLTHKILLSAYSVPTALLIIWICEKIAIWGQGEYWLVRGEASAGFSEPTPDLSLWGVDTESLQSMEQRTWRDLWRSSCLPHCCDGNRLSSGHGWEREMGWCRAATTEAPAVQVERRRSKFFFFSEILEMKSVAFPDRLGHGEGKKGIKDIANVCDRGADILESIIATQKTAGDLRTGSKV